MTCLLCNGVPDPNICDDLCESCLRDGEKLHDLSPGQRRAMQRKIERREHARLRRLIAECAPMLERDRNRQQAMRMLRQET